MCQLFKAAAPKMSQWHQHQEGAQKVPLKSEITQGGPWLLLLTLQQILLAVTNYSALILREEFGVFPAVSLL